jgi:basic amino acid/polyamine antiporter, APA family
MTKDTVVHLEKKSLKRKLGIFDLFAVGYGDVGSSIYYALGVTALFALGATPIALGLAGIVFICTALTYAEMSSAFPESGGSAAFSRYAFNDLISFIAGWGLLLDYIVTIAISAFAIPPYLSHLLNLFGFSFLGELSNQIIATIFAIGILFVLNVRGIRESTAPSIILSFFTIVTQVIIIVIAGFMLLNIKEVIGNLKIGVPNNPFSPSWPEFWKGTAMAMVAYTGIESIAQLGSEAKNPAKVLPGAIKLTMYTLIVLYLAIAFVAFSAVTPQELGTTYVEDPIAGIVSAFPMGATVFAPWVGLIAAIILFIASNSGLIGASRLSYFMGQYYQVPRQFYKLHSKYRTPYVALAFFSGLAIIVVLISRGKMLFLADLYNFGAMIAFFSCHVSLIVLRFKQPNLERPFRAPLNIPIGKYSVPLTAVIGAFSTLAVWFLIVFTKPDGRNVGFIWLVLGVIMYIAYRKKKQITATGTVKLESVKLNYEPITFKKILVATRGTESSEIIQVACEMSKVHNAKLYAVHILEVPLALPFNAQMAQRAKAGELSLKRAEAIARENNLAVDLQLIRARSMQKALSDLVKELKPDLVIIGSGRVKSDVLVMEKVEETLRKYACKVWICRN